MGIHRDNTEKFHGYEPHFDLALIKSGYNILRGNWSEALTLVLIVNIERRQVVVVSRGTGTDRGTNRGTAVGAVPVLLIFSLPEVLLLPPSSIR